MDKKKFEVVKTPNSDVSKPCNELVKMEYTRIDMPVQSAEIRTVPEDTNLIDWATLIIFIITLLGTVLWVWSNWIIIQNILDK